MTEQPPSTIGSVAQEAARLIEDMATMARSSQKRSSGYGNADDSSRQYDGWPAQDTFPPNAPPSAARAQSHTTADEPSGEGCSVCGGQRDETPAACRICPLCRGIALLRSVRPETVDLLADLALSMAAGLRDVAARTRASEPTSSARSGRRGPADADRDHVQDIPVDDESEGRRR